ncbi:hypothetical protein D3C72_776690 [compost metagenome]
MAKGAVGLGRNPHAAVAHRPVGSGKVPCQLANVCRGNATVRAHGLRAERRDRFAHRLQTRDRQVRAARQAFSEQGVEQATQQGRIPSRANEQVTVGHRRCFAASRVHHHQAPTPGLQRFQALFHIRHGHDAAVGCQRVAAEDQHETGLVDVRDRQQQAMAVHQVADQVLRQLVHRSGREAVAGFQQAQEVVAVGHQAVVVHARVALVHRHGIAPMGLLDRPQPVGSQGKGLVPADGMPVLAHPLVRLAQAVGVVLDVLQGHGLWADMAAAERVLGVALDRTDQRPPVVVMAHFDVQPTDRFAQVTGTVMQGLGHGRLCLVVMEDV